MTNLKRFKLINKIEGISFLILLFIAMPLKYYFGYPLATKIVGMTHGILVFAFIYQLIMVHDEKLCTLKNAIKYSILSLIPFGSFVTDKELGKQIDELS